MPDKLLKILSMPVDEGGCGWYRVRQPFEMIKAETPHDAYVMTPQDDGQRLVQAGMAADVAVVRQGGEAAITHLKKYPEFQHLKWVIDIDDNIELISPYSQHYREYGTKEFFDPNLKRWIWKTGEEGFNPQKNNERVTSLLQGMRQADLVTVTTDRLAAYTRQYSDNVAVLPNLVDLQAWWPLQHRPKQRLRVGWSGGVSHYEDWFPLKAPLNRLLKRHQFTLVMVGSHYEGVIDPENRHLVEVRPWVPFAAHSYRMMALELDLALIPLADLPFNVYKSPIKLYEMSAMGVPSLVSAVGPYADALEEIPARSFTSPETFEEELEDLLTAKTARDAIGQHARTVIERRFDARKNANLWTDAYKRLLTTKS